jgi:hypothetical protein
VGMNQRRFNNTKGAQHRKWDDTASNLTWQTQEFQLPMRDLPFLVYSWVITKREEPWLSEVGLSQNPWLWDESSWSTPSKPCIVLIPKI